MTELLTAVRAGALGEPGRDYARSARVAAPATALFEALTTLDGLAGWWSPLVTGSPGARGGQARFEFEGLDEAIVMRVDQLERPSLVVWTCLEHTSFPEWNDTRVRFDIEELDDRSCMLTLRHIGLSPAWDYFFASLVGLVERGEGTPYRANSRPRGPQA
jgi:hypothetical protein